MASFAKHFVQDFFTARIEEVDCKFAAHGFALFGSPPPLIPIVLTPVEGSDAGVENERVVFKMGPRSEGDLAPSPDPAEKSPLGHGGMPCRLVMKRLSQKSPERVLILSACDAQRSLSYGGNHNCWVDTIPNVHRKAETGEARHRQDHPRPLAFG